MATHATGTSHFQFFFQNVPFSLAGASDASEVSFFLFQFIFQIPPYVVRERTRPPVRFCYL